MGNCSLTRQADFSSLAPPGALLRTLTLCGAALALLLLPVPGSAKQPASTLSAWTLDDVIRSEEAASFSFSPDARQVVWVKKVANLVKNRRLGHLVLSRLNGPQEIRLTRGADNCQDPKWSPDGRRIAFITNRALPETPDASADDDPAPQLWLINPSGGEPRPLTRRPKGVTSFAWADPDTIIFAGPDPSQDEEDDDDDDDDKDDTIVVEDPAGEPPIRLFRLSVKNGRVTRITDNKDRIESFALSPDGRHAVTFHNRSQRYLYDNKVRPLYFLYDLPNRGRKQIFEGPRFNLTRACWTPDGKGFFAVNAYTTDPRYVMATVNELWHFDLAAGSARQVELGWERGLAAQWDTDDEPALETTEDGFVALLADGARNQVARYTRQGNAWQRTPVAGEHVKQLFGLRLSRDGKSVVYAFSTPSTPTQWYTAQLDGARLQRPVRLTLLNEHLQGKTLARTELVRWKGARDEEVEGLLYYPHHYQGGTKHPLVVIIHGGPFGADFDAWDESWSHPQNLLCARGAFVLRPNYHGSSNYGLRWAESIAGGRYYDLEIPDIEKGVDALIARGLVDPERLGVMGRSNGAILAAALTVHTTRYRAASVTAGTVEQTSDWACTKFGAAFDHYYLGKSPFEDPQLYLKKSPFYRMDRVRTPTLICFGAEDKVVGPQQGWLHYRALQQTGKAPVRFLLFPGEGHELERLKHQRRKLREELAWFDRYLFQSARKNR
jgi:dipeptidyl aminopeptidase/acylaminoacyl peptidase